MSSSRLTNSHLLAFHLPYSCCKNSSISWFLPYLFRTVPQSYLRGYLLHLSTQYVLQIKHSSPLLSCAFFVQLIRFSSNLIPTSRGTCYHQFLNFGGLQYTPSCFSTFSAADVEFCFLSLLNQSSIILLHSFQVLFHHLHSSSLSPVSLLFLFL